MSAPGADRGFAARRLATPLIALALGLAAAGCGAAGSASSGSFDDDGRFRVATTTNFITDTVREVGGERVQVIGLMGPGVDPHLYKASAGDVRTLRGADLIVYNGLLLEAKTQDVLEEIGESKPTLAITRDIPRGELLEAPSGSPAEEEYDPHVWFDVSLWRRGVETLRDELVQLDPDGADTYERNARAYLAQLDRLDQEVRDQLATIPRSRRALVTSHDAFRYLGRAYDIDVAAIQGISTASEATTRDVERIAELIASRGIKAVFVESSVPKQTIEAVLAAAKKRGQGASIGGELYSDAAGPTDTPEGSYIGMVRANVERLVEGLR